MFMVGIAFDRVHQYSLVSAWDLDTLSYDVEFKLVSGQDANPQGIFFKPDGNKMFMVGSTTDRVYEYTLGTVAIGTAFMDDTALVLAASNVVPVTRLLIPAGHNLSGMTLDIEHSSDGVVFTPATPQWIGVAGLINKSWAQISASFWRFTITTPSIVPQLAEIFLTDDYTFERAPSRPAGQLDPVFNILADMSASGQDRFLVQGDEKRRRTYFFPNIGEAQKDNFLLLNASWQGSKPFWLKDHTGVWIFGKLDAPMAITEIQFQRYRAQFSFLEVLP